MKQFFAKYLPVEGDIKGGDLYEIERDSYAKVVKIDNNKHESIGIHGFNLGKKWHGHIVNLKQKVKLFLCSRDIQVGDTAYATLTNKFFLVDAIDNSTGRKYYIGREAILCPAENAIKRIGEISPNAKYVKEGDEFDENQVRWTPIKDKEFDWEVINSVQSLPYDNATIQIKCPCCETFK